MNLRWPLCVFAGLCVALALSLRAAGCSWAVVLMAWVGAALLVGCTVLVEWSERQRSERCGCRNCRPDLWKRTLFVTPPVITTIPGRRPTAGGEGAAHGQQRVTDAPRSGPGAAPRKREEV